jgi:hypothetical protein
MQTTLRFLQAHPESKLDLKPAEKSRTAAVLRSTTTKSL